MIVGIGIDLIDNRRVDRELGHGAWQADDGIFTAAEIRHCSAAKRTAARFAACFAAKEATLKALGLRVNNLGMYRDVEVGPALDGECIVLRRSVRAESARKGVGHIRLSVARSARQTGAMVLLEA